jgi:ribosome-binding ATPase
VAYYVAMSLSIGIIGLPNVGKSTLFNSLLKKQSALAANYPFATIEPNIGIVDVPDERLDKLCTIVKNDYQVRVGDKEVPEKVIPAAVKFVDIAGLVKGAAQGEGLGNKFLSHIREVDAIAHVVRAFEDEDVARAGSTTPASDIRVVETELGLADLQVLEKRVTTEQRTARGNNKDAFEKLAVYEKLIRVLDKGGLACNVDLTDKENLLIKDLNLLTLKPAMYIYNVSEEDVKDPHDRVRDGVYLCAKLEEELISLNDLERIGYMQELGIHTSGLDKVIKRGYALLDLQTFLTAGPKEVRAWTIKKGTKAPQAAGTIHTDFERGFISAAVAGFDSLMRVASWKKAREQGLIRLEGRDYVMCDGDVVEFRFSV